MELKFKTLRDANTARLPQFKDRQGNPAHERDNGSDWTPAEWMTAMVGEVGELAGELKKARRGDYGQPVKDCLKFRYPATMLPEEVKGKIRREAADVVTYLDLFCKQFDIDLGEAVREKFNEVSERVGSTVFIGADDQYVASDDIPF